ncbi:sensor histidine kinase [Puia dinghuensis]|uniref:Sensor histidine kinase n=1 Tax=Puia dinghuensis TaxID=1792502 RepID=A0A8J2UCW9_9BACT|nr:histidine kinase [Puia dinghuensis]GGA98520.1 sensor histidine kinase [Puia dinghuensis]
MFRIRRKYSVVYHIVIWALLFLCIFLLRSWNHGRNEVHLTDSMVVVIGLPYIALFYLHAYWLIPGYLFQRKRTAYVLLVLGILLIVVFLAGLVFYLGGLPPAGVTYFQSVSKRIAPGLFILLTSASVGAFREASRLDKIHKEKENEHLRTELSFLRAQVNPHFMLNVLNSMVLLARKKSDHLEPVLMELARLMNYMLYDANDEKIRLEDEIGYLRAFIDLQLLRFGDDVTVRFNAPEKVNGRCIEPMLLIPLVENAFKHGIGLVKEPVIYIDIAIENNTRLAMTVKNKYNPVVRQQERRFSGIGLGNLNKRLELIYPGEFELQRTDTLHVDAAASENWFIITLNIPLQ